MDEITSTTPNKPITQKDAQTYLRDAVIGLAIEQPKTATDWMKGLAKVGGPTCLLYAAATPDGGAKNTLMAVGVGLSILAAYLSNPNKIKEKSGDTSAGGRTG